jgi:hypothetical protein
MLGLELKKNKHNTFGTFMAILHTYGILAWESVFLHFYWPIIVQKT